MSDIWLSGGDAFLDLEVVLPSTSLQQQENVKTGQKGHLHKNPLFALFAVLPTFQREIHSSATAAS